MKSDFIKSRNEAREKAARLLAEVAAGVIALFPVDEERMDKLAVLNRAVRKLEDAKAILSGYANADMDAWE